jgi:hypothetical protein
MTYPSSETTEQPASKSERALPCRCAAWLATGRLQPVVNRLGVPVALTGRDALLPQRSGDEG